MDELYVDLWTEFGTRKVAEYGPIDVVTPRIVKSYVTQWLDRKFGNIWKICIEVYFDLHDRKMDIVFFRADNDGRIVTEEELISILS